MSRNNRLTVSLALCIGLATGSVFVGSLAAVTSGQDLSTATLVITNNSAYGPILTDPDGLTLYTWAGDEPGESYCYDECATSWPPLLVSDAPIAPDQLPGTLGVTTRADGTVQATYNTMPLYHSDDDDSPGDVYGQGSLEFGALWSVVSTSAETPTVAPTSLPSSSPTATVPVATPTNAPVPTSTSAPSPVPTSPPPTPRPAPTSPPYRYPGGY